MDAYIKKILAEHGLTLEQFDEASNHPYECRCPVCVNWWRLAPRQGDGDDELPIDATGQCYSDADGGL